MVIIIAAKVINRPLMFCKWSHKGSHLRGGVNSTGDPILTNAVFHAVLVIPSFILGDHEGLAVFVHGRPLKRTLLISLPAILIGFPHLLLRPARDFLVLLGSHSPAPVHPAPGNSVLVLCILHYFLLLVVLLVKLF